MMRRLSVLIVALAITALALPAQAQPGVRCDVRMIHATGGASAKPFVDPALKSIASYLKKSFGGRYVSFEQIELKSLALANQGKGTVELPNERPLSLTYKGYNEKDKFIRLFMELPHLRTTVKIRNGGLFFQAGQSYKGGMLILAIHASLR